jgi:hypothetical protein
MRGPGPEASLGIMFQNGTLLRMVAFYPVLSEPVNQKAFQVRWPFLPYVLFTLTADTSVNLKQAHRNLKDASGR